MNKFISKVKDAFNQTILHNGLTYIALSKFLYNFHNLPKDISDFHTIYIDVSIYAKSDSHTGIQRVIREVILQILQDISLKDKVKFIVATKKIGYREVPFIFDDQLPIFNIEILTKFQPLISPTSQDLFLGLDFCPSIIPFHLHTFIKWKLQGVSFVWVLYDLLPVSNPEWFTVNIQTNFTPWLKSILLIADTILCISKTVENEMYQFSRSLYITPNLVTIRLGQNFSNKNTISKHKIVSDLPKKYVLMVGTIEPRKGHDAIIQAIHKLWKANENDYTLVLVGKQGWLVESLMRRIQNSIYFNKKLIWLKDIDDETLKQLYEKSSGVIVASFNEGYGLPLIEALAFNKAVFARDIPIFHEIAHGDKRVTFFNTDVIQLEISLNQWLTGLAINTEANNNKEPRKNNYYFSWHTTWQDIKANLIR